MDYRLIRDRLGEKEKMYLGYIDKHIETVQKVWAKARELLGDHELIPAIDKEIADHDLSKYFGQEFLGYRQFFYPKEGSNKNKDEFLEAWNHHQKSNKHHWEYHVIPKNDTDHPHKVLYMGFIQITCMLCDWTAMSLFYKNSPTAWYKENKRNMILHKQTAKSIDEFLPVFEDIYNLLVEGQGA